MNIIKYTIKATSGWISPLRSDTLHGLIACQVAEWEGEEACTSLLEEFANADKPFACSSAMPSGFFPAPILAPMTRDRFKTKFAKDKKELFKALQTYKQFKKQNYIPIELWQKHKDALSLEVLFEDYRAKNWALPKKEIGIEQHNTINRNNAVSLEGGLFSFEVNYSDSLLDIYVQAKDHDFFKKYLEKIGKVGFGADSNLGKGRFEIIAEEDANKLFENANNAKSYLSLSVISSEDLSIVAKQENYYKCFTKKGKAWAGKDSVAPFKKPFIALEEGSILANLPSNGILKNVHKDSQIVQLCHGLALPCSLQNNGE